MKIRSLLMLAVVAVILASCGSTKEVPYLIDAPQLPAEVLSAAARMSDPVIMPGDILHITVMAPDVEAIKPFNKASYMTTQTSGVNNSQTSSYYNYLVDNNGNIEFPLLGTLKLSGMSVSSAQSFIASLIYPRYLTVQPGIEIRITNFRVYVLGAIGSGVVSAPNGRLNIIEAIAQQGDLNIKGRRDNIMIVRTNSDGSRTVKTVNLNDRNLILSPDFYLQQNDIIYVEPNDSMKRSSWSAPPGLSFGLGLLGTAMSITTFILALSKRL